MAESFTIDRRFLERLERLTLQWRKSFPGLVGGRNRSRFGGPGQEFLDHRTFHHGDDLRAVNWRAYLRLERMFLKVFMVEPRVPVRMLIDTSGSMSTGDKFAYARHLAAALTYVALVRLDTIHLIPYTDRLGDAMLAGGGRHRFAPVAEFLGGLRSEGESKLNDVVRQFVARYPQRGLLVVISDFLDEGDVLRPLQLLSDFGHELLLLQVWSDEDRVPTDDGELELTDAETGKRLELSVDAAARARYTAAFDEYSDLVEALAMRTGGRYAGLSTSMPVEDAIFGPIARLRGVV
jgi:uncharacterized protein (DUF58 family)